MATSTQISMLEYLHTNYRPDREYVDGELVERNVGKYEHSFVQAMLAAWFMNHRNDWGVVPLTEQRVQVSPTHVRIPDLAVVPVGPAPDVLIAPPVLVIEILSPEDSYSDLQKRSHDYQSMGVSTIWIIDPTTRSARMCTGDVWMETRRLEVSNTGIYVDVDQLFQELDASRKP
jgi:Uma2 family endonuclease